METDLEVPREEMKISICREDRKVGPKGHGANKKIRIGPLDPVRAATVKRFGRKLMILGPNGKILKGP
jgi:hypothetical protein